MKTVVSVLETLVSQAFAHHAKERRMTVESIRLIGKLVRVNAVVNLGMTHETFARRIGLMPSTYFRRAQVAQVLERFPEIESLITCGEVELSTVALLATKITDANSDVLLKGVVGRSRREFISFASRVMSDGTLKAEQTSVRVTVSFSPAEWELIERVRVALSRPGFVPQTSEILAAGVRCLLNPAPVEGAGLGASAPR